MIEIQVTDMVLPRSLASRVIGTVRVIVPMVIAIGLVAGCTFTTASPKVTVTVTATTTPKKAATPTVTATTQGTATTSAAWPTIPLGQAGVIGVAPSPPFPAT